MLCIIADNKEDVKEFADFSFGYILHKPESSPADADMTAAIKCQHADHAPDIHPSVDHQVTTKLDGFAYVVKSIQSTTLAAAAAASSAEHRRTESR